MPQDRSPLAAIFSTIDSVKRVVGDALSDPAQFVKSAGENVAPLTTDDVLNWTGNGIGTGAAALGGMIIPARKVIKDFALFNGLNKSVKAEPVGSPAAETIFRNSGVYRMPQDDVLRAVVSDLGATIKSPPRQGTLRPLEMVLDHPELFKAMPELKGVNIRVGGPDGGGHFDFGAKPAPEIVVGKADPDRTLSVILHEVQHATQDFSGMSRGGNPAQFIDNQPRLTEATSRIAGHRELALMQGDTVRAKEVNKDLLKLTRVQSQAVDNYLLIPGEAEARLTQHMFESKIPATTFPPRIMAGVKSLDYSLNIDPYMVDLTPEIQKLLDVYAPYAKPKP